MPRGIGREGERSQSAAKDGDCRTVKGSREKSNNRIEQTEEKKPNKKQQHNQPKRKRKKRENEKRKKGKKGKRKKGKKRHKKMGKSRKNEQRIQQAQTDAPCANGTDRKPRRFGPRGGSNDKRAGLSPQPNPQPDALAFPSRPGAAAQKIKAAPKRRQTQKSGEKPNGHSNDDRRIC